MPSGRSWPTWRRPCECPIRRSSRSTATNSGRRFPPLPPCTPSPLLPGSRVAHICQTLTRSLFTFPNIYVLCSSPPGHIVARAEVRLIHLDEEGRVCVYRCILELQPAASVAVTAEPGSTLSTPPPPSPFPPTPPPPPRPNKPHDDVVLATGPSIAAACAHNTAAVLMTEVPRHHGSLSDAWPDQGLLAQELARYDDGHLDTDEVQSAEVVFPDLSQATGATTGPGQGGASDDRNAALWAPPSPLAVSAESHAVADPIEQAWLHYVRRTLVDERVFSLGLYTEQPLLALPREHHPAPAGDYNRAEPSAKRSKGLPLLVARAIKPG